MKYSSLFRLLASVFLLQLALTPLHARVLTSEVMYHPPPAVPEDPRQEWIGLHNTAEDDWSDLIGLTYSLRTNVTDAAYLLAISTTVNVDEWLRFFAVNSLILNMETTIATGTGDDYSMYRGIRDPRSSNCWSTIWTPRSARATPHPPSTARYSRRQNCRCPAVS